MSKQREDGPDGKENPFATSTVILFDVFTDCSFQDHIVNGVWLWLLTGSHVAAVDDNLKITIIKNFINKNQAI